MNRFHVRNQGSSDRLCDGLLSAALLSLVISVTGCQEEQLGGPRVETVPVTGKILVDGHPVEGVTVIFIRTSDSGVDFNVPRPAGATDKDGVITLNTYLSGDGVPPGDYKVAFLKSAGIDPLTGDERGDAFGYKYADGTKSKITVTIPDDVGGELYDFGTIELSTKRQ